MEAQVQTASDAVFTNNVIWMNLLKYLSISELKKLRMVSKMFNTEVTSSPVFRARVALSLSMDMTEADFEKFATFAAQAKIISLDVKMVKNMYSQTRPPSFLSLMQIVNGQGTFENVTNLNFDIQLNYAISLPGVVLPGNDFFQQVKEATLYLFRSCRNIKTLHILPDIFGIFDWSMEEGIENILNNLEVLHFHSGIYHKGNYSVETLISSLNWLVDKLHNLKTFDILECRAMTYFVAIVMEQNSRTLEVLKTNAFFLHPEFISAPKLYALKRLTYCGIQMPDIDLPNKHLLVNLHLKMPLVSALDKKIGEFPNIQVLNLEFEESSSSIKPEEVGFKWDFLKNLQKLRVFNVSLWSMEEEHSLWDFNDILPNIPNSIKDIMITRVCTKGKIELEKFSWPNLEEICIRYSQSHSDVDTSVFKKLELPEKLKEFKGKYNFPNLRIVEVESVFLTEEDEEEFRMNGMPEMDEGNETLEMRSDDSTVENNSDEGDVSE